MGSKKRLRRTRRTRRTFARSGRLAPVDGTRRTTKHHHYGAAAEMSRAQSGRKRLAVPALTTGCRTASSNLTMISSTTAVWRGTSSSISPGASCPSDYANGHMGSDQWHLV